MLHTFEETCSRNTNTHTKRQTDRQTGRLTDRQIYRRKQTDRHADAQTHRRTYSCRSKILVNIFYCLNTKNLFHKRLYKLWSQWCVLIDCWHPITVWKTCRFLKFLTQKFFSKVLTQYNWHTAIHFYTLSTIKNYNIYKFCINCRKWHTWDPAWISKSTVNNFQC